MSNVTIYTSELITPQQTHQILQNKLPLNHYYAQNADSLYEALTMHQSPLRLIIIIDKDPTDYSKKIIDTFIDASKENQTLEISLRRHL